ncbi:hypothetical protein KIPB_009671, partial [Kipferlia bialata]
VIRKEAGVDKGVAEAIAELRGTDGRKGRHFEEVAAALENVHARYTEWRQAILNAGRTSISVMEAQTRLGEVRTRVRCLDVEAAERDLAGLQAQPKADME